MRAIKSLLLLLPLVSTTLWASPEIQHWTSANGARVYYVHAPELPMVDLRLVFDAGSARDGDHPGLAQFTNALLAEGAGGLDSDTIAERFAAVGAEFGNDSLRDMGLVSLRSLTDRELLDPALDTFIKVVAEPDFPPDAIERTRQQLLTGLRYEQQDAAEIASRSYYKALYGDHPYASSPSGDEATISAIRREDLSAFHRRYYVAANAVLAIVGALDRPAAEALAERVVSQLAKGEPAPELAPVAQLDKAVELRKEHPSSQTHILIGQPGSKRGDADYFALYVGNHILGGNGLVSRISDEVREKRGLAYSAYSYFAPMRLEGPFTLGLQTKNSSADEALKVLRDTLKEFIADGPSEAELQAAKDNITGGFALNIDSNKDIIGYLAMIGFYELPLDHLATLPDRVKAVSVEQIRETWQRRIHPDQMVTILVGGGE